MLVPHSNAKHLSFRMPFIGIILTLVLFLTFSAYLVRVRSYVSENENIQERLKYYQKQFAEIHGSIQAIRKAERELTEVLQFKSKEKILEEGVIQDSGSVDIDALQKQIQPTVETAEKIKNFLKLQRNIYLATPKGLPVAGINSSPFGMRENPVGGGREFHPAIDIRAKTGTPVKATADGVISFSGWATGSGNIVVVEHGFGYLLLCS